LLLKIIYSSLIVNKLKTKIGLYELIKNSLALKYAELNINNHNTIVMVTQIYKFYYVVVSVLIELIG